MGVLGLSSASLSALSILPPYQTAFQVLAILALGAGFWMVYTSGRSGGRLTKLVLWLGAGMMALVLTSGWWHPLLA